MDPVPLLFYERLMIVIFLCMIVGAVTSAYMAVVDFKMGSDRMYYRLLGLSVKALIVAMVLSIGLLAMKFV